jgi:hypothetical protein
MYRQFRQLEHGEHIVIGADTSQGGDDECYVQFLSKTKIDVPIVYQSHGVAAQMTAAIFPVLERIHDLTGLPPTIAVERQNGGASEMERFEALNRKQKYRLFQMPKIGQSLGMDDDGATSKLGWDTTVATRPTMLGELKYAIQTKAVVIYDDTTIKQLFAFIVSASGKPEAAVGKHDDAVMALAIAWQLFQRVDTPHLALGDTAKTADQFDRYGLFVGT